MGEKTLGVVPGALLHCGAEVAQLCFCSSPRAELGGLLKYVRPFLNSISKAKAARLVRSLLDLFLDMEAATGQEVRLPPTAHLLNERLPWRPG